MTLEARKVQAGETIDWIADAAVVAGQVIQLRDGRAGVVSDAAAAGDTVGVDVTGLFEVQKTASIVVLMGTQLFWDHSANKAHVLYGNDRDFPLGTAQGGGATHVTTATTAGVSGPTIAATAAGTSVIVDLNKKPYYNVSLADGYHSIPVSTAGWPHIYGGGNSVGMKFDLTAEAQKLDALSLRAAATESLGILDALVCINLNMDDVAGDFNVGVANTSHATDFDSITQYMSVHIDGGSLNIMAQSADGTTTVASADTTDDAVVGTPFLVQFDMSNTSDVQLYINGVNRLASTVFKLVAATGPLKFIAHMEKTSNDSPGNITVMNGGLRSAQV